MDDRKPIIEAILKTASEIPSLMKGERNNFAKYNYVGIDTYYEEVASIARKNGLSWVAAEESMEQVYEGDSLEYLSFTYVFDLMHKDGIDWPAAGRLSVLHPVQGAQTSGSALAYAEKMFMRQLFKVVTGEVDADASPAKSVEAEAKGGRSKRPSQVKVFTDEEVKAAEAVVVNGKISSVEVAKNADRAVEIIENAFLLFLPQTKTIDELKAFWVNNDDAHKTLEKADKAAYNRVRARFAQEAERLNKKGTP